MADNNKKEPGLGNKSLLASAITLAPMGIGAAVTGVRAYRGMSTEAVPLAVRETIQVLGKVKESVARPTYNTHMKFMNIASQRGLFKGQGAKAARTAWTQALAASGAYSAGLLPSSARTIATLPEEQIPDALTMLARNESDITRSVFSRFRNNFAALSGMQQIPNFVPVGQPNITGVANIPPPTAIGNRIKGLAGNDWYYNYYSRQEFANEGLGLYQFEFGVSGKQLKLNIPVSSGGAIVEGLTQSSRRISPDVGILDPLSGKLNVMTREEYFLEELNQSIIRDIKSGRLRNQSDIDRAIGQLYQTVYGQLESIPNIPGGVRPPGLQKYQEIRGRALDLLVKNEARRTGGRGFSSFYRSTTMQETTAAMRQHGLFAGTGGESLARGRVQRMNLAERSLFPTAVDWSRKPEATIRPFQLTQQSADAINKSRYAAYKDYEALAAIDNNMRLSAPHLKSLYVDPTRFGSSLNMGEGTALGRRSLSSLIGFEYATSMHLKTVRGGSVSEFISGLGSYKPGEVLGWDPTGNVVKMEEGMKLLGAVENITEGKGGFVTVSALSQRALRSNEKWFGDFKGLMRLTQDMWFDRQVKRLTNNSVFAQNIDAIISMDELKKDPSKFSKQILTAMSETARGSGAPSDLAADLAMRPRHYAEMLGREAMIGGGFSNEAFVRSAMKTAVGAGIGATEFGTIFGAVPYVLGNQKAESLLREVVSDDPAIIAKYMSSMSTGVAGGVAGAVYGGPEELRGAGALASLEPRAFEVLRGPAFGGLGGTIKKDLLARLVSTNPAALATSEQLMKTIQSMGGLYKPGTGARFFNVKKEFMVGNIRSEFQRFIETGGGWIRPGSGLHDIYTPGADILSSIRPYTTAEGRQITGELGSIYHRIVSETSRLYSGAGAAGVADVEAELQGVLSELHYQQAPAGKGLGSYLRGQVTGGRFFTGVDPAKYNAANPFVVGLPAAHAAEMFDEMERLGMYDEASLQEMRKRFVAGEDVAGIVARHPLIGEYSMQPALFRKTSTRAPQMEIPEFSTEVALHGTMDRSTIKLGPLVGMAGDKDADLFSAMLVSPDIEKQLRNNLRSEDSEFIKRYTQHQVRYQMLKAKSAADIADLPTMERMIAGARKLAVIPEWVPQLSLQMSSAKRAVRQFGTGESAADAMMLLEWLEQTPISAKHLSAQNAAAGELEAGMTQLTQSLQNRDVTSLKEVMTDILSGNKVASNLLKGDISIEQASADAINSIMGTKDFSTNIRGVDLDRALGVMMSSMDKYRASGAEREMNILSARGSRMLMSEIPEAAALNRAMIEGSEKGFAGISKAALASINKLGTFGEGVLRNAKPLGIGFAAALGIGAILSTPEETIGTGTGLIPQGKITSSRQSAASTMSPEDVNPSLVGRSVGQPTAPDLLSSREALISPMSETKNIHVRAQAARIDNSALARMIRGIGNQKRINVNIRDERDSVNRHVMANKLY